MLSTSRTVRPKNVNVVRGMTIFKSTRRLALYGGLHCMLKSLSLVYINYIKEYVIYLDSLWQSS